MINETDGPIRKAKDYAPSISYRKTALDVPEDEFSDPEPGDDVFLLGEPLELHEIPYQEESKLSDPSLLKPSSVDQNSALRSWSEFNRDSDSTAIPEYDSKRLSHELKSSSKRLNGHEEIPAATPRAEQDVEEQILLDDLGFATKEGMSMGSNEEDDISEDSPFPEVRASVSNIDDPTMPVLTFRVIIISFFFATLVSGVNLFLMIRAPAPSISATVVMVVVYPLGKLLAIVLPMQEFHLPSWLGGYSFSLNPGPFNMKEHALIAAATSIAVHPSYVIHYLTAKEVFFENRQEHAMWYGFVLTMSIRVLGFGFVGILDRFLVKPASMLWPQTLMTTTILNTLHAETDRMDKGISRMRWLVLVSIGAFCYNFLPDLLFQGLSVLCWLCWIKPRDVVLNLVTGVNGMGFLSFTLDWAQISYFGSPLMVPWWCTCNMILGFVLMAWVVMPAMYFTNVWNLGYFPFSSINIWDKYGDQYQVQRVLDLPENIFNPDKYTAYSPVMLSLGFIISYFSGFANVVALLFHTLFNHSKDIWKALGRMKADKMDIHAKLMQKYKSVPPHWYIAMFIIGLCVILITDDYSAQKMSATALIVSILISVLYLLSSGYVLAQTGQLIGNNIFADLVGGYLLPQKPQSFMAFKAITVQVLFSALQVTASMKLGHYMKIPPRTMVLVQLVSVLVVSCVQVAVKTLLIVTVPDICSNTQSQGMHCIMANTYSNSALLWSDVGPHYIFFSQPFQFVLWGLLAGGLLPLIVWLSYKWTKARWLLYINAPLIFASMSYAPDSMSINFTCWFMVGFIFQFWLRRYRFRWWSKYNFVTADALDLGTVASELLIFFAIQLPLNVKPIFDWWGNHVAARNADMMQEPLLSMPTGGVSVKHQVLQ